MKERLLLEGGKDETPKELSLKMKIHGYLKTVRVPIIDSMRSFARALVLIGTLALTTFCLYREFGPTSDFFQANQVIEDSSAQICLKNQGSDPDVLFWPAKLDDGSFDHSLEINFLQIAKDGDQGYKAIFKGTKYRKLCFRADILRGLLIKVNDLKFWAMSQAVHAIDTITYFSKFQKWFTGEHDNDIGASSQKLGFLSVKLNNKLFGKDSYELQNNHNQKVDMRELVANERGAHFIFMNIANLDPTNDDEFTLTVA